MSFWLGFPFAVNLTLAIPYSSALNSPLVWEIGDLELDESAALASEIVYSTVCKGSPSAPSAA